MDVHFTRHCTKKWSFPLRISSVNLTKIYARTKFTRTTRKACAKNRNFFVFSCINFGLTSIKLTTLNNKRSILTHFWHEYVWYGTRKIPPWSIPPGEFPPIKWAPDNLPNPTLPRGGGGGEGIHRGGNWPRGGFSGHRLVWTFLHGLIILVSFLPVFIEFNFIFKCNFKLALRKFTRYIY